MAGIIGNSLTVQTKAGKCSAKTRTAFRFSEEFNMLRRQPGHSAGCRRSPLRLGRGMRAADRFRAICPQDVGPSAIPGRKPSVEPQDEDCLYLNVWTPAADNLRRPVMVWVHGGAFLHGSGSSPMTPAQNLAKRGGIVLVTINYRLGCLGSSA